MVREDTSGININQGLGKTFEYKKGSLLYSGLKNRVIVNRKVMSYPPPFTQNGTRKIKSF